jgi:AraC family transcriptional regulator
MQPRIETLPEKKLIGYHLTMSLTHDKTAELWQRFLKDRKEINNVMGPDLYNIKIYNKEYFEQFNPAKTFEKWAAVEVKDWDHIPLGMSGFLLQDGLYAIFDYKGLNTDHRIFEYIYSAWLPSSPYRLDDRPHVDVLGTKYKNADPESEEEIMIPIRLK